MSKDELDDRLFDFKDDSLPRCRYCGKSILPNEDMSEEAMIEYATMKCDCKRAVGYQNDRKRVADRKENIERINGSLNSFEKYCESHGVELNADINEHMLSSAILVLDNVLASAAIGVDSIKAKISKNAKGNVVISFTYSDGGKMEVANN